MINISAVGTKLKAKKAAMSFDLSELPMSLPCLSTKIFTILRKSKKPSSRIKIILIFTKPKKKML